MEVLSPGDLVPPVTVDQLCDRQRLHASRNPLIVRVLAAVGIMRDEGEGVPRIFEEMEESLLRQPRLAVEASQFVVVLYNQPAVSGPTAERQGVVSRLDLTSAQKRALLASPSGFTNEQYCTINGLDRDHADHDIHEMVAKGVLTAGASTGRGTLYRPSQELQKSVAWLEQRLVRLTSFFRSNQRLTNTAYREIFAVTRFVARHELARLVDEGFLVQKGQGRGAHYLPGRALADTR